MARTKGLKTKLGFTFRYAPAVQYAKELIDQGFVGEPYMFNGYEQNSQWIDPRRRCARPRTHRPGQQGDRSVLHRGLRRADHRHHALVGQQPLTAVVGTMRNFVPDRAVARARKAWTG